MFYENKVPSLKTKTKTFRYDLFSQCMNDAKDDFSCKASEGKRGFNFLFANGTLESGYGFSTFKSPTNTSEVDLEEEVAIVGDEISALWSFKWFNYVDECNQYYLMYFNGTDKIHYDNLFASRVVSLFQSTAFTSTPVGTNYCIDGRDVMVFAGEGSPLQVVGSTFNVTVENAPKVISLCAHYGKLFAITAGARGSLVYTQNTDLLEWDESAAKRIDFSDERGNLNKILSFNDYLYIFRDFGITKLSTYSTKEEFAVSHLYQADGYIYPGTIASGGDKIYFLEKSGLKVFNGSTVKNISLNCDELLRRSDASYSSGVCFEGRYYLACKLNFDDGQKVGCENSENFVNNALFVYDEKTGAVEISRGMDIRQLLVLGNPYKSKLVACFYNENKNKIGQLEKNGKFFDDFLPKEWTSVKTDFGKTGLKKITKIHLLSEYDCRVCIKTEREEKEFNVNGSLKMQTISLNILGEVFEVSFKAQGEAKISNVQIEYLERA